MIVAEMAGGLANQMIVYAAARALAEKHGTKLKIDLNAVKRDSLRSYALFHLNISAELASSEEIAAVTHSTSIKWVEKLKKKTRKILKIRSPYIYEEPVGGYDPNFQDLGSEVYLKGFFISRRYFETIESILRREFQVKSPLSETTRHYATRAEQETSISIHIRRGDYASNDKTRQFHGLLGLEYYQKAMEMMEARITEPFYYVFSDDISWARENLRSGWPLVFVDHTSVDNAYEDMYLMSQCKHNIIANSGFSYWGAWLNEHVEKVVIAPERWFADETYNREFDLLPPEWVRV